MESIYENYIPEIQCSRFEQKIQLDNSVKPIAIDSRALGRSLAATHYQSGHFMLDQNLVNRVDEQFLAISS